jgi:uncharacterized protein
MARNALVMEPAPFRDVDGGCLVRIRVTPRAARTEFLGVAEGRLRVRLQAPPVDGAANKALTDFFAKALSLPKSAVTVERGETGREKTLRIAGCQGSALLEKLGGGSK